MFSTLINALLAFGEGLALIVSPCILPILPIILAGSIAGSKKRPLGIIIGFIIFFAIITLFSRQLILALHINQDILRIVSFILLVLFGVIMIFDRPGEAFTNFSGRLSNAGSSLKLANNPESGFLGGFLFGGLVGVIWTPCAGPIFAAVIVQVISQATTIQSVITVLAFAIGVAIPMFLIALAGRAMLGKFGYFKQHARFIRKILGFIIIISVIFMWFVPLENLLPQQVDTAVSRATTQNTLINGLAKTYAAPPITDISEWINSPPLSLDQLRGKVVLIDFWTYSCINCIRTLPFLKSWYANYHQNGFEIIGIHSPEFAFEQNPENVKNAVKKFGINYPVALDNRFSTWQAFQNRFWPAHYLINKEGQVVYIHFGEGAYDVTENNIRFLLGLNRMEKNTVTELPFTKNQTPETYLGFARAENYAGPIQIVQNKAVDYLFPTNLENNQWGLQGKWTVGAEKITSDAADAALTLRFTARKVFAVMGRGFFPVEVTVYLNKVKQQTIQVDRNQLYTLVELPAVSTETLELVTKTPGLEVYAFTFGG